MTKAATLTAEMRPNAGKGAARATRRSGKVPAVIYGDKQPPLMIAIEQKIALKETGKAGFFTHLYDIAVGDKTHRVLPRDVHYDPITDRPLHIDFLRVAAHTRVRVAVPLHFSNQDKSPGLKRGGMLNIVAHELELLISPDAIPERLEIDLTGQEMNASIHLAAVALPKGAQAVITDQDYTLATIVPPAAAKAEEATATAAAATPAAAPAAGKAAAPAAGKAAPAAAGKAAPAAAKAPAKK
jgi:large subunit ribosomal protein L25